MLLAILSRGQDAAKHYTAQDPPHTAKDSPAPKGNHAIVEKLCLSTSHG